MVPVKPRYMLEHPKANSTRNSENLFDVTMGNQQATCESRESPTTTREDLHSYSSMLNYVHEVQRKTKVFIL